MAVYEETINLGGNISTEAKDAARQFGVLEKSVNATKDALTKAQATGNVGQYKKLTAELKSLQAAQSVIPKGLLDEVAAHKVAGEAHAAAAKQAAAQAAEMKKAATATQQMTADSGGLQAELAEMTGGLSIAVEAVAAVGAAFGALVIAGMSLAIEATEVRQKMVALFDALGEGKTSGEAVVGMLEGLSSKIGIAKSELAPLTQEFMKMGVTGKDALESLTLAAISAKALGGGTDAAADAFVGLQKKIQLSIETGQKMKNPLKSMQAFGITADDVAAKMGISSKALADGLKAGTVNAGKFGDALQKAVIEKGAGPLEQMSASLGNIKTMFMQNVMDLFTSPALSKSVGEFLEQVKSLFDIFSQGKASGQALKAGIGGFFKEVFASATKVVPLVKHFLLDVVIYGLKAYLAVKPIIKSFNEWRTSASGMKTISTVFSMIAAVLITVATVIGIAVAAFVGLWAVMVGIGVVIWAFIAAVIAIPQMAGAALADFFGKAPQMAKDFIMGLVDGIKNGAGMVVDAVKGMASGAVDSFKGALGIHSPSKVMMQMGAHVASGAAAGIDDGAPDVHGASTDLAKAAAGGFASGGASAPQAGAAGASGGIKVTVEAGAIVIQGGSSASVVDLTEQAIALLFERVQLSQGL